MLKDVSFKFQVGRRFAIVGMNGSGKTTLIKLICRLYEPSEGAILLNGVDIRKYAYQEYVSIFSVVFQDFKLFSFSLAQNVAAGVEYDAARVRACLDKVGFGARLSRMPKGIETSLYKDFERDGIEPSGGEAQKIALARAVYKNAPFIILDEPTAALDPVAEAEVYAAFNEIVGGRTAVYISHRLSSCRFCDQIMVFHEGALVQQGTHSELVTQTGGKYAELWNAQAQYYI
ncbi:MAG: ABC transporter ATP-binding protein/permease [Lachnospiraceae bacterium]|nr:ABC transporter ATP-binding protein/permease [Lachnospiraceae bacterium]